MNAYGWKHGLRWYQPYPLWAGWDYYAFRKPNGVFEPRLWPYSCWYGIDWQNKLVELLTVG